MKIVANQDINITAQLKDIKPLLDIPDNSYYIYWGVIGFISILLMAILFFIAKKLWDNRKINLAKGYLKELETIDWIDSKSSAYKATHYARLLSTDDRLKELFTQLEVMLEQYKYKKDVDGIDENTKKQFNLFMQVANERV